MLELIPYEAHHVPLVHSWLADNPNLRELVGTSDPNSLEQEYEYQRRLQNEECGQVYKRLCAVDSVIIGDIDVFVVGAEAEINLMIADASYRSKGLGGRFLQMALSQLPFPSVKYFVAKIHQKNEVSLRFFRSQGFVAKEERPNVFGEYVLMKYR